MFLWMRRHLPAGTVPDAALRRRAGAVCGSAGVLLNLLLFGLKLWLGQLGGAISVTADAFNNLSDAAMALATAAGFWLAAQRADAGHPYGHGRIEYLTGLLVSVSILLMGVEVGRSALERALNPQPVRFEPFWALALLGAVAVKLYMHAYQRTLAARLKSEALRATAADSISDALATLAVLLGQLAAWRTGWPLDGWLGMAVALFILWNGLQALLQSVNPLIGQSADPALLHELRQLARSQPQVLDVHDVQLHDYGPSRRMVTLHAELDSRLSFAEAHSVADALESALAERFQLEAVVHADPVDSADAKTLRLKEALERWLAEQLPGAGVHDFRQVRGEAGSRLLFDLVLPWKCQDGDALWRERVCEWLKQQEPGCDPQPRVERGGAEEQEVPPQASNESTR